MPTGYLMTVALLALYTLAALAPPRRPRPLAMAGFLLGLLANELPFAALAWLLASTVLAYAQGDLSTPGAWACLALAALVAAGLAEAARRGLGARPVLDAALAAGLGAGWRSAVDPGLAAGLRRRTPWARILLRPVLVGRRGVERVADIAYGTHPRHRLDVYRHRSRPAGAPVLVYWHGGGYSMGDKNREGRSLLYRLASQGWVCVSANYRLRPEAGFGDHLSDAKRVLAWVRAHGAEYGADPATVVVSGSSAGAHLAALCALTPNDPRLQPGFADADTSVSAAVCLYGYFGRYYTAPANAPEPVPSSPLDHLRPDAPPLMAVHGDRDTLVPAAEARAFTARLRQVSRSPVVHAELPGAQHAFDLVHSPRHEAVVDAVEAFTAWVRSTQEAVTLKAPSRDRKDQ
ncbi:acetyl esterase/lipase [Streptomonospora nanhaiensis]|uniref:Acetyl esterase/lipase n=1 Tax=Streptomonospora nanhaiensis TaxID=1323731 RepID=A0A853BM03_9ACTN|nr:alpha/beta hydrolase [Streptomonospora nanhaiensis]NYI96508.1 acetyl esterase/lipase [Streptomonospora nanhaiensis]